MTQPICPTCGAPQGVTCHDWAWRPDHLDLTSAAQSIITTLDAAAAGDLGTSHAVVATILWHRLVGGTEDEAIAYARTLAADPDTRVHAHTAPF